MQDGEEGAGVDKVNGFGHDDHVDEADAAADDVDKTAGTHSAVTNLNYTCDVCRIDHVKLHQTMSHYERKRKQTGYTKCCNRKKSQLVQVSQLQMVRL